MDIRRLTDAYAVSPQIAPADVAALKAAGFVSVICNRPDAEVPAGSRAEDVRAAAEAAGLRFVMNPIDHSVGVTPENIAAQGAEMAGAGGPVFAYCASGNRCTIVWALAEAGQENAEALIANAARFGYRLEGLRPALEARAKR